MAIVSNGFWLSITVMDNGGDVTTRRWKMQAATQEAAETDAPTVVTDFLALTDAVLVSRMFGEEFVNDALSFPAAGVENQNQALLDFIITDQPTKHATQSIPAPKIGIFAAATGPNAEIVDIADTAVAAWAAHFAAAGQLYLSDGETADALVSGRRRHVASRRG